MSSLLKQTWDEIVAPIFQRPNRVQVAALCYKGSGDARQVLLVTSRGTGRWILPKGWPMDGKNAPEAARQEAWEEAGVTQGQLAQTCIGTYAAEKEMDTGGVAPCTVMVFPLEVEQLAENFPESDERTRKWVSPIEAAELVDEKELQDLLRTF